MDQERAIKKKSEQFGEEDEDGDGDEEEKSTSFLGRIRRKSLGQQ